MENLDHTYTAYGVPKELARREGAKLSFLFRLFGHEIMMLTTTGYPSRRVLEHPNYVEWEKEDFEPFVHDAICLSEWSAESVTSIIRSAPTLRRIREAGYPFAVVEYAYMNGKTLKFVTDLMDEGMPPEYAAALVDDATT